MRMNRRTALRALLGALTTTAVQQLRAQTAVGGRVMPLPLSEVRAILKTFERELPLALRTRSDGALAAAWERWLAGESARTRARLERGDEDSIVNLWYYGTSFTREPRLSVHAVGALRGNGNAERRIVLARLDDLIAALGAPDGNDRLLFAVDVLRRRGIDISRPAAKAHARQHLLMLSRRILDEEDRRNREVAGSKQRGDPEGEIATHFTLFRDRGLSSDTLLLASFSVDQALQLGKSGGLLPSSPFRRVAVIGPGLDFADKADGFDFYPVQTIQPFALIDSLMRLGLAASGDVRLTTIDVSARVNRHLEEAVMRARDNTPYVVQLPLDRDVAWHPDVVEYWNRFGTRIGAAVPAKPAPPQAGNVEARAVSIAPDVVQSLDPQAFNVVLERPEPPQPDQKFDLMIATNVLVYYDVFQQNLALANIARLLRPGGVLLSNTRVSPCLPLALSPRYYRVTHNADQGDHMFWYSHAQQ